MNEQLADYIRKSREAGVPDQDISESLIAAGWNALDVSAAMGTPERKKFNWKAVAVPVIVLAVLFGGYMLYAKAFNTPEKVWNGFGFGSLVAQQNNAGHVEVNIQYADQVDGQPIGGKVNSVSDYIVSGPNQSSKSLIKLDYDFEGTKVSLEPIEIRKINNIVYVNIKPIPFFGSMADDTGGWIKLDLDKYAKQKGTDVAKAEKEAMDEVVRILNRHKIIADHKYLGSETVADTGTYHYSFTLDKKEMTAALDEMIDSPVINNIDQSKPDPAQNEQDKKTINEYMDRLNIASSEVWIGKNDHILHKVAFDIKTPAANMALGAAKGKAANAKILADVRQLNMALELYYNNNNKYPKSLADLAPTYIGAVPAAPTENLGECSGKADYAYKPDGKTYTLDFCFDQPTGGYERGYMTLGPNGISTKEAHPEWKGDALAASPQNTGDLVFDIVMSAKAKVLNITAPDMSKDILDSLGAGLNPNQNSSPAN